jgi:anti-sigma regulatory factor (Ser/Thr protein kinase)
MAGGWRDERTVELPPDLASVATARTFLRDLLEEVGVSDPTADAVILLASELVSNAVLHAGTTVTVRVVVDERTIRVEVGDRSPVPPRLGVPVAEATSGRGLALVRELSEAWGVDAAPGRKVIWFELAMHPESGAS